MGINNMIINKTVKQDERFYRPELGDIKSNWLTISNEDLWSSYEACLSAVASMTLKSMDGCLGIILKGQSGSGKTTVLNLFKDLPSGMSHYTDRFTPAAFLTQAMNVSRRDIERVDLIRRLPDKVMVVPDLAPLFGTRYEELNNNLTTLTRVMDGQGLANDGGIHGHREFREECIFVLLGAVVKIRQTTWSLIASMGPRLLFHSIKEIDDSQAMEALLRRQLLTEDIFSSTMDKIKLQTNELVENLVSTYGIRKKEWTSSQKSSDNLLIKTATLVSKLRSTVDLENGSKQTENPYRVCKQLKNLARGRAILYGRNSLNIEDNKLVMEVALSSVPGVRGKIAHELLKSYPSPCILLDFFHVTGYGETKLRQELGILEMLGVVKKVMAGNAHGWIINEDWIDLKETVV